MRITTTTETIQKVKTLLHTYDADTEQVLNDMPTREKYAILALAKMIHQGCYEDYEEAYDEATRKVSAQGLTKYLMEYEWLWCHLQDVVQVVDRHGWEPFEVMYTNDEDEDEEA
jgi:hypothetical protein